MLVERVLAWLHRFTSWNRHSGDLCGFVLEWNLSPTIYRSHVPVVGCFSFLSSVGITNDASLYSGGTIAGML